MRLWDRRRGLYWGNVGVDLVSEVAFSMAFSTVGFWIKAGSLAWDGIKRNGMEWRTKSKGRTGPAVTSPR